MKFKVFFMMMCVSTLSFSNSIDEGLKLYESGDYVRAINSFKEVTANQYDADLYYNLGNAYFKNNQLGLAIANYKKAIKIKPAHKQAKSNLKTVEYRKLDKIRPLKPFILSSLWEKSRNMMSSNLWFAFAIVLLSAFCFFIGRLINKKHLFFNGSFSFIFLITAVVSFCFAVDRKEYETTITHGVVVVEEATLHISPNEKSKALNYIHEGTSFELSGDSRNGFYEVIIANGDIGWVEENKFEGI